MDERNKTPTDTHSPTPTATSAVTPTDDREIKRETKRREGNGSPSARTADDYDRYTEGHAERGEDRRFTGNGHDGASSRSPVALMRHLVADVALLFRKEVALAAAEVNQSVHGVTTAAGSMLSGGAILHAGIIFLLAAAVIGLAEVMALWLSALIVGGVVTVIGIIMVQAGKKKLEPASFKPERTVDSLRKDKEALRRHTP